MQSFFTLGTMFLSFAATDGTPTLRSTLNIVSQSIIMNSSWYCCSWSSDGQSRSGTTCQALSHLTKKVKMTKCLKRIIHIDMNFPSCNNCYTQYVDKQILPLLLPFQFLSVFFKHAVRQINPSHATNIVCDHQWLSVKPDSSLFLLSCTEEPA